MKIVKNFSLLNMRDVKLVWLLNNENIDILCDLCFFFVMLLTAVHCLPGGMDENKRNCMVRFSSLMDRDEVLQKEIALKSGSGYSVVPDLPPSVSILRSKLLLPSRVYDYSHYIFLSLWMGDNITIYR
jgi:hypothetical protein